MEIINATIPKAPPRQAHQGAWLKEYRLIENFEDIVSKTNDKTDGDNIQKSISGNYWMNGQYYYGGYADYYVSYGDSSYDPPIQGEEAYLANSEICFNK